MEKRNFFYGCFFRIFNELFAPPPLAFFLDSPIRNPRADRSPDLVADDDAAITVRWLLRTREESGGPIETKFREKRPGVDQIWTE